MYKQMYERTNGWKISSFYRTLSPIGAAAQKGRKEGKKEGKKEGRKEERKKGRKEGRKESLDCLLLSLNSTSNDKQSENVRIGKKI